SRDYISHCGLQGLIEDFVSQDALLIIILFDVPVGSHALHPTVEVSLFSGHNPPIRRITPCSVHVMTITNHTFGIQLWYATAFRKRPDRAARIKPGPLRGAPQ